MFIYLSVEWHVALVSTFFGNVSANSITVVSILLSIFYTCHEAWWDVTCLIVPHSAPVWQVMFTLMYSDHFFHLLKHIVPCRSFRREKMLYLRILSKIEMILVYFFTVNEMHHQGGVSLAPDLFCSRTITPNIQAMSLRTILSMTSWDYVKRQKDLRKVTSTEDLCLVLQEVWNSYLLSFFKKRVQV